MESNIEAFLEAWPRFQEGIVTTIYLTLGGAALGFAMALVLGVAAGSRLMVIRGVSRTIVEFFRGTSLLVQLFWLFFVLPLLGYELDPLFCGILALGLNYGAYAAEVVRGSLAAVPTPQKEAAVALNFSPWHRMSKVVFPQAWVQMIPPLNNLLVQLLKGSALASFILLQDLTFHIGELRRVTGDTVFAFGVGLILYFVIAYVLTLFMNLLEVRAKSRLGAGPSLREVLSLRPERVNEAVGVGR
ncbi:amino acid ABC transporter membrane protein 1, PAAT family [Dietzia kunjamensis subsp. schimae]|uniref:Ectoine/hydroxyectoine ABC transporter permease subunit EhuC n=2 Tax=Dietzia TaxID=37914 RepID=A0A365P9N7_9ACTN|nr:MULTISPECIES: ectoine/hydroxyectoine ABC transporter permease subunit EhuC [Dietzia]MBB0990679.1 ectoine/hydroxyectoine ABC transporter permease subunit EhuC [Dietzia sp. SLG510A3-30A2]MBB0993206.1 ectoine/hydroxyectoine ABC transporter permease subunit EhuC [Dietzia sp. SLG510A3-40A3]MBB1009796.1 ectoine/hydroxyectoine ABC transporter permease subunit EhuC [Dietzia sp. SLG510A3-3B2-2]MVZ90491.1 ectoine/hydroxyectoine ABC transporter permease subunit EhuC [Microbacter sp. ANSKLAB05]ODQ95373